MSGKGECQVADLYRRMTANDMSKAIWKARYVRGRGEHKRCC